MNVLATILLLPVTEKLILYECNCSYIDTTIVPTKSDSHVIFCLQLLNI